MTKRPEFGMIHAYDFLGRPAGIYPDVASIVRDKQMNPQRVRDVLRGRSDTTKSHFLLDDDRYPEEHDRLARIQTLREGRRKRVPGYSERPIVAYDLEGKRLGVYESTKDVVKELDVTQIRLDMILRGDGYSTKGYAFAHVDPTLTKKQQDALMVERLRSSRHHHVGKKVFQYTMDGEFVASFKNASEAGRQLGIQPATISACTHGRLKHGGGFLFLREGLEGEELEKTLRERVSAAKKPIKTRPLKSEGRKRVKMVDIHHYAVDGTYITRYTDARHAFHAIGISNATLRSATSGLTLVTGHGLFLLEKDFPSEAEREDEVMRRLLEYGSYGMKKGRAKSRPVALYTTDNEHVKTYPSILLAARDNGLNRQSVNRVLHGKVDHIDGKVFRYVEK